MGTVKNAVQRVEYLKEYANHFGINSTDSYLTENTLCENFGSSGIFSSEGSAHLRHLYWTENDDAQTFGCRTVQWQTKYPISLDNGYDECVKAWKIKFNIA